MGTSERDQESRGETTRRSPSVPAEWDRSGKDTGQEVTKDAMNEQVTLSDPRTIERRRERGRRGSNTRE